jgi:DNA repair exonuclease SbcCD ATPase subunit
MLHHRDHFEISVKEEEMTRQEALEWADSMACRRNEHAQTLAAAVRELEDSNQSIRETAKNHGLEEAHTIHDDPRIATLWCVRYLSEGLEAKDTRIEELTAELAAARGHLAKAWSDKASALTRAEAAEALAETATTELECANQLIEKLEAENAALRRVEQAARVFLNRPQDVEDNCDCLLCTALRSLDAGKEE